MDEHTAADRLDRKSSLGFYLCIFFDLMDIAMVNSYLIYYMKHPNKLPFLDYKIAVGKNLIQYNQDQKRLVPMSIPSNLSRLIIMEGIYQISKQWGNNTHTLQWRIKKIEHSSSVWLLIFQYAL